MMFWPSYKTKLCGIMGRNVVKLAYLEFIKKKNSSMFEKFECLKDNNPVLFSKSYYYAVLCQL